MTHFKNLQPVKNDTIFHYLELYFADKSSKKVNLSIGAYRDDDGLPYIFDVVKDAERDLLDYSTYNKEYTLIDGVPNYPKLSRNLIFKDCLANRENRIASIQTIAGTGSLRLSAELIKNNFPHIKNVYISDPTWGPHRFIFDQLGLNVINYPYYSKKTCTKDFPAMLEGLNNCGNDCLVVLHTCAHNPTGIDLTKEEWKEIAELTKIKNFLVLFDSAYLGFASGDFDIDAWPIKYFEENNIEFLVSQSFSKNMGLYGERIGALHIVCKDSETASLLVQNLKLIIRSFYTSPSLHGARIVNRILENEDYLNRWKKELEIVATRVQTMRSSLISGLKELNTPGNWDLVGQQKGMFSYLPLSGTVLNL
uniref:Aspartate aminotransferase n=1 Tax=Nephromyces sp. MMRI TaxID=2496275 RepID=A0A3S8V348_9APIC|nr:cytosolic aspartate aminotransferase [Nephromyces sp. MMRI]